MAVNINKFFVEVLRAKVVNNRWSWGAYDSATDRVYLRLWSDLITKDGKFIQVLWITKKRVAKHGFNERVRHLDMISAGAAGFGVLCTAANPNSLFERAIADFDKNSVLKLGRLITKGERIYTPILGHVPVTELSHSASEFSDVSVDLRNIAGLKGISKTTREALIDARVGQGAFRNNVLRMWNSRCAVTSSSTRDAIRASHIKPWSTSTNEERLDPENGLPLIASLDALFDAGLVSFDGTGEMLISTRLAGVERKIFSLSNLALSRKPSAKMKNYLAFHRRLHFLNDCHLMPRDLAVGV